MYVLTQSFIIFCIFIGLVLKIEDLPSDKYHYNNASVEDDDDDGDVTFKNSKVQQ
jgi:hypothetical protein